MAKTFFSKEQNKWVSEIKVGEHTAIAFDAITNMPIFYGDMVRAEQLLHGKWVPYRFMCFDYSGNSFKSHYCERVVAAENKYHYIKGIPHHYIKHSQTIRYYKVNIS